MTTDEAKIVLLDSMINNLENGSLDENVQTELTACIKIARTLENRFEKHIYISLLNDMVRERIFLKELQ